jgi:hypothetical protein
VKQKEGWVGCAIPPKPPVIYKNRAVATAGFDKMLGGMASFHPAFLLHLIDRGAIAIMRKYTGAAA